jgi:hypothetical protein
VDGFFAMIELFGDRTGGGTNGAYISFSDHAPHRLPVEREAPKRDHEEQDGQR